MTLSLEQLANIQYNLSTSTNLIHINEALSVHFISIVESLAFDDLDIKTISWKTLSNLKTRTEAESGSDLRIIIPLNKLIEYLLTKGDTTAGPLQINLCLFFINFELAHLHTSEKVTYFKPLIQLVPKLKDCNQVSIVMRNLVLMLKAVDIELITMKSILTPEETEFASASTFNKLNHFMLNYVICPTGSFKKLFDRLAPTESDINSISSYGGISFNDIKACTDSGKTSTVIEVKRDILRFCEKYFCTQSIVLFCVASESPIMEIKEIASTTYKKLKYSPSLSKDNLKLATNLILGIVPSSKEDICDVKYSITGKIQYALVHMLCKSTEATSSYITVLKLCYYLSFSGSTSVQNILLGLELFTAAIKSTSTLLDIKLKLICVLVPALLKLTINAAKVESSAYEKDTMQIFNRCIYALSTIMEVDDSFISKDKTLFLTICAPLHACNNETIMDAQLLLTKFIAKYNADSINLPFIPAIKTIINSFANYSNPRIRGLGLSILKIADFISPFEKLLFFIAYAADKDEAVKTAAHKHIKTALISSSDAMHGQKLLVVLSALISQSRANAYFFIDMSQLNHVSIEVLSLAYRIFKFKAIYESFANDKYVLQSLSDSDQNISKYLNIIELTSKDRARVLNDITADHKFDAIFFNDLLFNPIISEEASMLDDDSNGSNEISFIRKEFFLSLISKALHLSSIQDSVFASLNLLSIYCDSHDLSNEKYKFSSEILFLVNQRSTSQVPSIKLLANRIIARYQYCNQLSMAKIFIPNNVDYANFIKSNTSLLVNALIVYYARNDSKDKKTLEANDLEKILVQALQELTTTSPSSQSAVAEYLYIIHILYYDRPLNGDAARLIKVLEKFLLSGTNRNLTANILSLLAKSTHDETVANAVIDMYLKTSREIQHEYHVNIGKALHIIAASHLTPTFANSVFEKIIAAAQSPVSPVRNNACIHLSEFVNSEHDMDDTSHYIYNLINSTTAAPSLALLPLDNLIAEKSNVIQDTFIKYLDSMDEFVQGCAINALRSTYDVCKDPLIKKQILDRLLGCFMGDDHMKRHKLTLDTNLDFENATNLAGDKLNTYQDLCSLATDLNNPDLIYKFLSLSNANSLMAMKKGAVQSLALFNLSDSPDFKAALKALVPRLFQFKHDPNIKTRETMTNIWKGLISNEHSTIVENGEAILKSILDNIQDSSWRKREAACASLQNLLIYPIPSLIDNIYKLWEITMGLLDDIKESVRKVAEILSKSLSTFTLRQCNSFYVSDKDRIANFLSQVVPFFLDKGVESPVKAVLDLSIEFLVKLCETKETLLQKHVPVLIATLIKTQANIEPAKVNYIQQHVNNYKLDQEKFDAARESIFKGSPLEDAIDHCVSFANTENIDAIISQLLPLLKIPSLQAKLSTLSTISKLSRDRFRYTKPLAQSCKITKLLLHMLINDTSKHLKKKLVDSLSLIVAIISDKARMLLVLHWENLIKESDDEDYSHHSRTQESLGQDTIHLYGALMLAIYRKNSECFDRIKESILPYCFLFKTLNDKRKANSPWNSLWDEAVTNDYYGANLYYQEVLSNANIMLSHSKWKVKVIGAQAITRLIQSYERNIQAPVSIKKLVSTSVFLDCYTNVQRIMKSRIFTGKEYVFESYLKLVILIYRYAPSSNNAKKDLKEALTRIQEEATKLIDADEYLIHMYRVSAQFITELNGIHFNDELILDSDIIQQQSIIATKLSTLPLHESLANKKMNASSHFKSTESQKAAIALFGSLLGTSKEPTI